MGFSAETSETNPNRPLFFLTLTLRPPEAVGRKARGGKACIFDVCCLVCGARPKKLPDQRHRPDSVVFNSASARRRMLDATTERDKALTPSGARGGSSKTPSTASAGASAKPNRQRGVDGCFRCYRCPTELAVASVREKCCRSCLLLLVRRAFAAELAALRLLLSEQPSQQGTNTPQEEAGVPLLVAVSGGDASLSLLHLSNELIQRRQRVRCMQQQNRVCEEGLPTTQSGSLRSAPSPHRAEPQTSAEFACCVSVHVDLQRLFLPSASCVEARLDALKGGLCTSSCSFRPARSEEGWGSVAALSLPTAPSEGHTGYSLPLELQQAVTERWPSVRCVFLHPLGVEFSIVKLEQKEGSPSSEMESPSIHHVEVYMHPGGQAFTRQELLALQQEEAQLRMLLYEIYEEDKAAAERFCRILRIEALRQYRSTAQEKGLLAPGFLKMSSCLQCSPFICFGDSASSAALRILERMSYGEGRLLSTEAAPQDARLLPSFCLCRPLVTLSKKELSLFRLFERLPVLPTKPYTLHQDLVPSLWESSGSGCRRPRGAFHPSAQSLLQEFLIETECDNSATIHNLLSAVKRLESPFKEWGSSEIRESSRRHWHGRLNLSRHETPCLASLVSGGDQTRAWRARGEAGRGGEGRNRGRNGCAQPAALAYYEVYAEADCVVQYRCRDIH
ncbi:uncharacterized protein LOC34619924 [Cyclospora cayetanensis]|uniref:Uncharacterized protein LOC34619924 n=1 Tax=Cyclospora cayetanensis TaxID=88456 RepID=A0A6P6RQQ0_9EIME|nr:uncharacterized protein LOC34619924 [Cyclospora cayetanensis]